MYTFTVFTPTFNRAHTLHRVYESLQAQVFRDFEWLIIDDGSSDGTRDLITKWERIAGFPIHYFFQENQGKHVAHNRAVAEARGAWFLTLDSDDSCVPTALARFKHHWDSIPLAQRGGFSAVTALCADSDGRVVGTRFPRDITDSDPLECHFRYKVTGEKWGFQRTDILRQFPLPGPEVGRSYMPEALIWWSIGRRYKTRYVNEILRIYHHESESITRTGGQSRAPGGELFHRTVVNSYIDYFRYAPLQFLRSAVQFVRFSFHLQRSLKTQWDALTNSCARMLWIVALPSGFGVFLRDLIISRSSIASKVRRRLAQVLRERRPVRFLFSRLLWGTGLCRFFVVRKDGFRLRFYPSSLSALYWTDPEARSVDETFLSMYLRPGDTLVDVGANIGVITSAGAVVVGEHGRVYAIEAHPRVYSYLIGNIRLNGFRNVVTYHCALGDAPGQVFFEDRRADDMNSVAGDGDVRVPMLRLDDLDTGAHEVALLKVDVEGYEKLVLEGAKDTLRRTRAIFIECCDEHFARYGYSSRDLLALLRDSGFTCLRSVGENEFTLFGADSRCEGCENLLAIRDLDEFSARARANIV